MWRAYCLLYVVELGGAFVSLAEASYFTEIAATNKRDWLVIVKLFCFP